MSARILAACSPGETRVAVVRDGELVDYGIWRPGAPDGVGDVHTGRVGARVPAMAGTFVVLAGSEGFLPDSAGAAALGVGDVVTVRVTRAAQGGKGPRLTLLDRDGGNAGLLSRGPGLLLEFAEQEPHAPVVIDDAGLAARLRPALGERLSVASRAWDEAIEEDVAALASPSIELAGGARLHVEPTRALTAIDVDAGGAVASRQGKTAAHLAANQAAIGAVARQIRLRNLSGAILVDFAGLSARRRASLGPTLGAALAEDPRGPGCLDLPGWGWRRSCGLGCIRRCTRCWPGHMLPGWPRYGRSSRRWRWHRIARSCCGPRRASWQRFSATARRWRTLHSGAGVP